VSIVSVTCHAVGARARAPRNPPSHSHNLVVVLVSHLDTVWPRTSPPTGDRWSEKKVLAAVWL
jgi:hypothetical protein